MSAITPEASQSAASPSTALLDSAQYPAQDLRGFPAFAPDLAEDTEGFDPTHHEIMYNIEANHFWYNTRNRLIHWAINKYASGKTTDARSFLEIGCGTGVVLKHLSDNNPNLVTYGSELLPDGLSFTAKRLPNSLLFQMDARNIPFKNTFNAMGAFDVIEHIDEDETVLAEIHEALAPEGIVLITVPQHPWMWSSFDAFMHHKRRYTRNELQTKLEQAGFKVEKLTSFISLPFPAMLASRTIEKLTGYEMTNNDQLLKHLKASPVANALLDPILALEANLIKAGLNLPMGGSLLAVARKV